MSSRRARPFGLTRRTMLRTGAGVGLGALAGCTLPELEIDRSADRGVAAFFALWDWCREIAGEEIHFDTPVPIGRVGHGFDPEADLIREVANTAVFVYLDTPEFAWAQDIASELRRDYAGIAVIDGLDGFTSDRLLGFDTEVDITADRTHDWDPETVSVAEVEIVDRRVGEVTAYLHGDHWHGGIQAIPENGTLTVHVVLSDTGGRVLPLDDEGPFELDVRFADNAPEDVVQTIPDADRLTITGVTAGRTQLVLQLRHDNELVWELDEAGIDLQVVDELEAVDVDEFYDPHVWVDPVLAQDIVDNLVAGLGEIVPESAETFEANAASYSARLAGVDTAFRELMDSADRSVAVFAGHDSFRYLEHRYDFELHSPAGVSPDRRPSQRDIAETIALIENEEIDTILYDPFETPHPGEAIPALAEVLIESSPATEVAPLTPVEGTTEEWSALGWGWIEQMEEINLPSLRRALGAK